MPTEHISFDAMLDAVDETQSLGDRAEAHLAACETCNYELRRLENLVQSMRLDESVDAPRDVLAYAINIFAQRKVEQPSLVRRIVAALTFDSFERAPAFGLRSSASAARQLLYHAVEKDIDIRINKQGDDRWQISGQILGENCAGGQITLQGDEVNESARMNEQCEFVLPPVPAGAYHLLLKLRDVELEVSALEVGNQ